MWRRQLDVVRKEFWQLVQRRRRCELGTVLALTVSETYLVPSMRL
jgi:hypothetical protein